MRNKHRANNTLSIVAAIIHLHAKFMLSRIFKMSLSISSSGAFDLPQALDADSATVVVSVPAIQTTERLSSAIALHQQQQQRNLLRPPLATGSHHVPPIPHGLRHSCSFCSYSTIYKDTLVKHERTHTGDRPFRCLICGYAASQRNNVRIHAARKHGTLDCVYDERKIVKSLIWVCDWAEWCLCLYKKWIQNTHIQYIYIDV